MPACYILRCADDSYYVGSTRDLAVRLAQHESGIGSDYTAKRLPVELAWAAEFDRIDDAYFLEKRIQGWSRRKREALIRGELEALPELSRKRRPRGELPL
jgi:putative endonuclease